MTEQMFKIGDEVETDEIYKTQIEELNSILGNNFTPYKRGIITNIQTVQDKEVINGFETGKIINTWTCATLDDDIKKQVNQIYLKFVEHV